MDKVYTGIIIVDEKMIDATTSALAEYMTKSKHCTDEEFEECVKMYSKLLDVKESIHRERAKAI